MSSRGNRMHTATFFEKKINILPVLFSTTLCFAIFHVSMAFTNFNGYNRYPKQDEHQLLLEESIKTLVNRQQNQEQHYDEQAQKQQEKHLAQLYQQYQLQQQQYSKDHQSIKETITNIKKLKCSTRHLENESIVRLEEKSALTLSAFKRWPSLRGLLRTSDYMINPHNYHDRNMGASSEDTDQPTWPIFEPMYNRLIDRLQRLTQSGFISGFKDLQPDEGNMMADAASNAPLNTNNQLDIRERFQRKNKKSLSHCK